MIINLRGKVMSDGAISFDLVPVYFTNKSYVHATELFLLFDKQITNANGYITSTLIDRSIVNQTQQLLFFNESKKLQTVYYSPRHISQYKITADCLENCKFKLFLFDKSVKQDFHKLTVEVYLQLKISTGEPTHFH